MASRRAVRALTVWAYFAYDLLSGKQLWVHRLQAGVQAMPMTYWSQKSQRQFLLAVADDHGSTGTKAGDGRHAIITYALPRGG